MDELETGGYVQDLEISPRVSHMGGRFFERVLTNFVPRSGRCLAKERMFPNVIHWVIRDGKRGVAVTPINGTILG